MTYVPLAIRTEYSLPDGMCRIDPLVDRAHAMGMRAVGIADLNSTQAWVPFFVAARQAKLQPILGVRLNLLTDGALKRAAGCTQAAPEIILQARNAEGLRNIQSLVSLAHFERGQEIPAVTFADLERLSAGVLVLDGGIHGPMGRLLLAGCTDDAFQVAQTLKNIFGSDHFFMQLQLHGSKEEVETEPHLLHIARQLNISLVATHDTRYLDREDAAAYEILRIIRRRDILYSRETRGTVHSQDPATDSRGANRLAMSQAIYYLKNEIEMKSLFRDLPEALSNTNVIAERCFLDATVFDSEPPVYGKSLNSSTIQKASRFDDAHQELKREVEREACAYYKTTKDKATKDKAIKDKANKKTFQCYQDVPVDVRGRIAHELRIIEEKKLASWYLIVQDVMRSAKEEGISVGPGCGAVTGSLVAFLLGLHQIDPLENHLWFEKSLGCKEFGMAKFEITVSHYDVQRFGRLMRLKSGRRRVFVEQSMVHRLHGRTLIREVGRLLGIQGEVLDSLIEKHRPLRSETVRSIFERSNQPVGARDHRLATLLEVGARLENMPLRRTVHSGSFFLLPEKDTKWVAFERREAGGAFAQIEDDSVSRLGWLQVHVHSSRSLSAQIETLAILDVQVVGAPTISQIPLDDEETYSAIAQKNTTATGALEGKVVRAFLGKDCPGSIQDLCNTLAAAHQCRWFSPRDRTRIKRPLSAKAARQPGLRATRGYLLYEEQIIELAVRVGGFGSIDANEFRMAIHEKRIAKLSSFRGRFVSGALERGWDLESAENLFDTCLREGDRLADRSFHTQQAILGYRSAYLQNHYPTAFAMAALNNALGQQGRIESILAEALERGVRILGPDINKSQAQYSVEPNGLRVCLSHVRGLGFTTSESIVVERQSNGDFKSLDEVLARCPDVGNRQIEALIISGAFTCLGVTRLETEFDFASRKPKRSGVLRARHDDIDSIESNDNKVQVDGGVLSEIAASGMLPFPQRCGEQMSLDLQPSSSERLESTEFVPKERPSIQPLAPAMRRSDENPRLWLVGSIQGKQRLSTLPVHENLGRPSGAL